MSWVGSSLRVFNLTYHGELKKIQLNPYGSSWIYGLDIFLITIIIIKSSIRTTPSLRENL